MLKSTLKKIYHDHQEKKIESLGKDPLWVKLNSGINFYIDPKSEMDQEFFLGTYERSLVSLIQNYVKKDDVVVDVGAHKGYITLLLSQKSGVDGRVISFEPDANADKVLRQNLENNDAGNVTLLNVALGDKVGTVDFYLNNYLGHSSRFPNVYAQENVQKKVTVPLSTMEVVFEDEQIDKSKISFIKIDAEGSEFLILKGIEKTADFNPLIHMEINFRSFDSAGISPLEVQKLLESWGYELYDIRFVRNAVLMGTTQYTAIVDLMAYDSDNLIDIIAINRNSKFGNRLGFLKQ